MKTLESENREQQKSKKKISIGSAGISLFVHLGLFFLVGGVVVVEYAVPRSNMTGELAPVVSEDSEVVPEESPEPAGEPEAAENPSEAETAPAESAPLELSVSPVDVLSISTPVSSFQMPAMGGGTGGAGTGSAAGSPSSSQGKGQKGKISNPFGGAERVNNASLEGILFDLKQTRSGNSTNMTSAKYEEVLREFFAKKWNRGILNEYYQVKKPLYASQIYMPLMGAELAPKAFGVEKEVKPSQWLILYSGTIQAPKSGRYRFAGYADDVLGVRIDGKNVLDGSRPSWKPGSPMLRDLPAQDVLAHVIANGHMSYSDWIYLAENEDHTIEILVGEQPGVRFCAFLFIEEKNGNYRKGVNGRPILPLFRTADMETVSLKEAECETDGPVFGTK